MPRRLVGLLLVPLLGACTKQGPEPIRASTPATTRITTATGSTVTLNTVASTAASVITLDVPIDQLWRTMPQVYADLGVTPETLVDAEHYIGNPRVRFRRRLGGRRAADYFDCGYQLGEANADVYQIEMSLHTRLQAVSPTTTRLVTEASASAAPVSTAGNAVTCGSTGRLERRISELAAEKSRG